MLGANFLWVENFPKCNILFLKGISFCNFFKRKYLQKNHNLFLKIYIASIITIINYNFEDTFENVFLEQF